MLVLLVPIVTVTLLLTEFDVLQDDPDAVVTTSDSVAQSTLVLDQTAIAEDVALQTATESATLDAAPEDEAIGAADDEVEQTYIVVPGDTLASIARRFGSDIFTFAAYNELTDINRLDVGQELRIPPPGYEPPPAESAEDSADAAGTDATQ